MGKTHKIRLQQFSCGSIYYVMNDQFNHFMYAYTTIFHILKKVKIRPVQKVPDKTGFTTLALDTGR
jgi:hypothetical protein